MLDTIFLQILDMTKIASLVILIVLLVRLCLVRAPKIFSYALWAVVLFRLLCPLSIEAPVSLIPEVPETVSERVNTVLPNIEFETIADREQNNLTYNPNITNQVQVQITHEAEPTLYLSILWLGVMIVLLIYSIVSIIKLHRKLLASVKLRDNIYIADHIESPFVMGLIRPRIYLPSTLSEKERDYILLHEQHHIRRGDHIVKLLSFVALCLHWFNPLVWAAFILSGKDMEMSCDEAVLRKLGTDIRSDYSASLISLATGRRIIAGTPLAFGEGNTKGRIKNIAKWKKPEIWVIMAAVIVCVILAVCLITDPMKRDTMLWGAEYRITEMLYSTDANDYADEDQPSVCITADFSLWEKNGDETGTWHRIGQLEPYALTEKELKQYTAYDDGWRRRYSTGEITDAYILRDKGETANNFFLAFRTKKGDTLLGYGMEDVSERGQGASDDTELYWLVRLESVFGGTHLSGEFHERSLTQAVGGDVDSFHTWYNGNIPGYMIVGFCSDDTAYTEGTQIPSPDKTDMGFAVFACNKDESGFRLLQCHVYEDAVLAENGIFVCPDQAVLNMSGEKKPKMTYDIVFVNNEAVESVAREYIYADGKTERVAETHIGTLYMAAFPWTYYEDGCEVWQYVYDEDGEMIDYSRILRDESAPNVRVWVDYFRKPEMMDWDMVKQITLPDYPDVTFTLTSEKITAEDENGTAELVFGMPIWNAFFTDLTGDGLAEICATVSFGSGIIDTHVVVYDYKTRTEYTLWERGVTDYALRELNGRLVCDKWEYPDGEVKEYGTLTVKNGELQWISGVVHMTPTTANISGAFDGYLYVPIDGANYRYELIFDDPTSVTRGNLIHAFTEEADPTDVNWRVYAVEDYPDRSVVLAEAQADYVHLYRYRPSKAVDPAMLDEAKEDGKIVLEDGYATSGQAVWNTFYKLACEGKHISADIVHYHTMENGNYDRKFYEAYKEDYPALYEFEVTHDGGIYTMKWNEYGTEYVRTYKYLRKFETTIPTPKSAKEPVRATKYVLTNDADATLEELWRGVASSQLGDYIDFFTIYSEIDGSRDGR